MLWPREWILLASALALLIAFTALVDAHNDWELAIGIDRAAKSWLHSLVCDRAAAEPAQEFAP